MRQKLGPPSESSEGGVRGHDAPHSQHEYTSVCGLTGLALSSEERTPGVTDTNSSGAGPIRRPGYQRHLTLPFRAAPGSVPARGSLLSPVEHSSLAPGHQPAPRGSERDVPNSLPALSPPPALSAPISGRPGVLSLAPVLSGSSAAPAPGRSRPSPGSRTCATAATRHLPAPQGTLARRPPHQPPPLARTGSSSFSERRTGTISSSPSSTSMGSGSPRSKPDSTSGDGSPKAGDPTGPSAFTDTRRPRTAAIAASRPHHRKPAPHNPPPRAPPPLTTEESRRQPERHPFLLESCLYLWRPPWWPGNLGPAWGGISRGGGGTKWRRRWGVVGGSKIPTLRGLYS